MRRACAQTLLAKQIRSVPGRKRLARTGPPTLQVLTPGSRSCSRCSPARSRHGCMAPLRHPGVERQGAMWPTCQRRGGCSDRSTGAGCTRRRPARRASSAAACWSTAPRRPGAPPAAHGAHKAMRPAALQTRLECARRRWVVPLLWGPVWLLAAARAVAAARAAAPWAAAATAAGGLLAWHAFECAPPRARPVLPPFACLLSRGCDCARLLRLPHSATRLRT